MRTLFVIILLAFNLYASDTQQNLLDSIAEYSIRIGEGSVSREYVFVDPLCPHSKKYVQMILEDKDLQKENSYFIFLYRLPKYDSDLLIQYIQQSRDAKVALREILVDEKEMDDALFDFEVTQETVKTINKIAVVAQKLKVDRRPQMFTFYDKVSSN